MSNKKHLTKHAKVREDREEKLRVQKHCFGSFAVLRALREVHLSVLVGVVLVGCARQAIKPSIDPGPLPPTAAEPAQDALPPMPPFSEDPESAYRLGRMPLYSTGIPEFLAAHPGYDGRGVLIAILDSGIDPGVPGLDTTTTGDRKLLDLRDFSGEGRIPLLPVAPRGDSVTIGGIALAGVGRIRLFSSGESWYGGLFREIPLGSTPGADVDGNGQVGDSLPVLVARASDGWVLFVDRDRDGSFAGERPIHDYLSGREIFGWALKRRVPRLNLAANISESDGQPVLDLFFDTSAHGTHVAGIAAGHNIYGIAGFNGVAPGAQLLGLKIANDAQGGLSTTGSMVRALDYAIRFAAERRIALVANMSFGVGNEIEGTARIDHVIDSVLTLHPELVFTVSAGNDGPGLSTVTFPGSARRVITAGSLLPGDRRSPLASRHEPVTYFSSRGGELAKPDIVTPGTAYSTVPLWNRGSETASGTSMAAPHAAGLAAILVSAIIKEDIPLSAWNIRQALMVTARPVSDLSFIDQGAGVPDIGAAFRWLLARHRVPDVEVRVADDSSGITAAFRPAGLRSPDDTIQRFELLRPAGSPPEWFRLRSTAPWLIAPDSITLTGERTTLTLHYRAKAIPSSGPATGVVSGWVADSLAGPGFRLVNTIGARPAPAVAYTESKATTIPPGAQRRLFIAADSGRPFQVSARVGGSQPILVFLHEPGGQPLRGAEPQIAGVGQEEVTFRLDGRDVMSGLYELVAVAPPGTASSAQLEVKGTTLVFSANRGAAGVVARVRRPDQAAPIGSPRVSLIGAERDVAVSTLGSDTVSTEFALPAWAAGIEVDFQMDSAQWSGFTDLGLTLFDSLGRQIEHSPLVYARGRLSRELESGRADQRVSLKLFPALAEPGSRERWTGLLKIRLYASSPVALVSDGPSAPSTPAEEETTVFTMIPSPWPLSTGFVPLGIMTVEQDGIVWTREVPLPDPSAR
jgi:subtilisin family serine protease